MFFGVPILFGVKMCFLWHITYVWIHILTYFLAARNFAHSAIYMGMCVDNGIHLFNIYGEGGLDIDDWTDFAILPRMFYQGSINMTPVFRTDPLLYYKFEIMVIFRSGNLIFTLYPRKPGLSENYSFCFIKKCFSSKSTMQKWYLCWNYY